MATNHPDHGPDDSLIRNPEVAYDHRDLGARGVLVFFAILAITGIAILFLIYGMYWGMQRYAVSQDPALHALAIKTDIPTPGIVPANAPVNIQQFPTPRLQPDDATDMRTFLTQEDRLLHAQPWKDEAGKVHIPIGMAIDLIAKRGLPSRNGTVPDEGQGIAIPGAQPPAGQTDSGNMNLNEIQGQADAVTVPGAPKGDTVGPTSQEKLKPIPGVDPNGPRNPALGKGEKQPR
jgi:hypothetical protein